MKKRMLAFLLAASVFAVLTAGVFSVHAAEAVAFSVKSDVQSLQSGQTVTVTVTADAINNVAGLQIALLYDRDLFSYKTGEVLHRSFTGSGMLGQNSPGKVSFVWSAGSDGNKGVQAAAGALFSVTFTAAQVDAEQTGDFNLKIEELFKPNWTLIPSVIAGKGSVVVQPAAVDRQVKQVEELIDAIGTVEYTEACGARIDAAYKAFKALKAGQQNAVSNYDTLSKALNSYAALREQQQAADHAAALQREIDAFKALPILAKTAVTVADADAISAALSLYGSKSNYIKERLRPEYEKLQGLQKAVGRLQQKSEAEIAAQEFRDLNAYVLGVQKDQMPFVDIFYERLIDAIGQYQNLVEANPLCETLLSDAYAHLMELQKEFERLQILNAPDSEEIIKAANAFVVKYARVLSRTAAELTEADRREIEAALAEYMALPNAAKGRLINQYEKLNSLIQPAAEGGETTIIEVEKPGAAETEYVYITKEPEPVEVPVEKAEVFTVSGIALGGRVVWFLVLFGIAFVFMCFSLALYVYGKKKYVRR